MCFCEFLSVFDRPQVVIKAERFVDSELTIPPKTAEKHLASHKRNNDVCNQALGGAKVPVSSEEMINMIQVNYHLGRAVRRCTNKKGD